MSQKCTKTFRITHETALATTPELYSKPLFHFQTIFKNFTNFPPNYFPPERPPEPRRFSKLFFWTKKMVQSHPQKPMTKSVSKRQKRTSNLGGEMRKSLGETAKTMSGLFSARFSGRFSELFSKMVCKNRLQNRRARGVPFGGCFGKPKSHCFFAVGFRLPCFHGRLCSAQTSE